MLAHGDKGAGAAAGAHEGDERVGPAEAAPRRPTQEP